MNTYKVLFVRLIAKWAVKLKISEDTMRKVFSYVVNTNNPTYLLNNTLFVKLGINVSRRQITNFKNEFKLEIDKIMNSPENVVAGTGEEKVIK